MSKTKTRRSSAEILQGKADKLIPKALTSMQKIGILADYGLTPDQKTKILNALSKQVTLIGQAFNATDAKVEPNFPL